MVMTWCCIILFGKTWRLLNVRPANRSFYCVSPSPSGSWVFGGKTSRRCVASHPWKLHSRVLGVWWHGLWLDHHKHPKSELVLFQTMNQRESIWIKWILDIWGSWDIYHSPPWLLRAASQVFLDWLWISPNLLAAQAYFRDSFFNVKALVCCLDKFRINQDKSLTS